MTQDVAILAGIAVLVVLVVIFFKVRQKDLIGAMIQKRQADAKLVSRADYMEGMEKIPVALSLTADTLYYENPDLEASFELSRIDEVEYDDELATGRMLDHDRRVMRLRSHGTAFEFVLEKPETQKWMAVLPPRTTTTGAPTAHAV